MRVVSLLPSATEIVAFLGAEGSLVGRSEECDYPANIRDRPVVMRARTRDVDRSSREIDYRVQRTRSDGESLYELDVELLARLRPELILTQDLCGVCSVAGDEVRAACHAAGVRPQILSLTPTDLAGVRESVRTIGWAIGNGEAAERSVADLQRRERSMTGPTSSLRRTIAVVEWLDPPILAGLWVPEMIAAAGGTPYPGLRTTEPGSRTTWEALVQHPPDALVLSPCSFSVDRTVREVRDPRVRDALGDLGGLPIWLADEAYFSRPGPRLWDGLELLDAIVHESPVSPPMPVLRWSGRTGEVFA